MNKNFNKMPKTSGSFQPIEPEAVKSILEEYRKAGFRRTEDGETIRLADAQYTAAETFFGKLLDKIRMQAEENEYSRVTIGVYGGSGSGKSGMAELLCSCLNQLGIGSCVLHGDHYPRRIPLHNDGERYQIFREAGSRELANQNLLTPGRSRELQKLQKADRDAEISSEAWLQCYREAGRKALASYLGSPAELEFDEVNDLIAAFKEGAGELWFKRMGRDLTSLTYEKRNVSKVSVLILEWTHAGSTYMKGIDLPVFLYTTPEETLQRRLSRGRDQGIDSPFTAMVLEIEQGQLNSRAAHAAMILASDGSTLKASDIPPADATTGSDTRRGADTDSAARE